MGTLATIRSQLGFSQREIEQAAGWPSGRLARLESEAHLTDDDADVLTRLYGVDVEDALTTGGDIGARQPLAALLRGQAEELMSECRLAIAGVSSVAREHRQLLRALGRRDLWPEIERFKDDPDYSHPSRGSPERLAQLVRTTLSLGQDPIPSMWKVVRRDLGILVLWVDLPPTIDAFAMAGMDTGAVVAMNVGGAHTSNAFVRRVTLAHELCHVLFDRSQMRAMTRFCAIALRNRRRKPGPEEDLPLEERIERRARAFAAALLVPREEGIRTWNSTSRERFPAQRVRQWMIHWGLGYEAARGHLDTLGRLQIRHHLSRVNTEPPPVWELAEPALPMRDDASQLGVHISRRGEFFDTVMQAVREGAITPARAREHLELSRTAWDTLVSRLPAPPVLRNQHDVSSSVISDWL